MEIESPDHNCSRCTSGNPKGQKGNHSPSCGSIISCFRSSDPFNDTCSKFLRMFGESHCLGVTYDRCCRGPNTRKDSNPCSDNGRSKHTPLNRPKLGK